MRARVLVFLQARPAVLKVLKRLNAPSLDSPCHLRLSDIIIASHESSVLFGLLQRGGHQDIRLFILVVLDATVVMVIFYNGRGTQFEISNALVVLGEPEEIFGVRRRLQRGEHVGHNLLLQLRLTCLLKR